MSDAFFLAGLVLSAGMLAGSSTCRGDDRLDESAEEAIEKSFKVGDKPKLLVENFNGPIDVWVGDHG